MHRSGSRMRERGPIALSRSPARGAPGDRTLARYRREAVRVGIELQRTMALGDDTIPFEVGLAVHVSQCLVCLREVRIERLGAGGLLYGPFPPGGSFRGSGEPQMHLRSRHS